MNIIEKTYNWNGKLSTRSKTSRIILHHAESSSCTADDIHQWHLDRGWSGIVYHFFVRKDGLIYLGRQEKTDGAQANGAKSDRIGISAEGKYMTETKPDAQKQITIIHLMKLLLQLKVHQFLMFLHLYLHILLLNLVAMMSGFLDFRLNVMPRDSVARLLMV